MLGLVKMLGCVLVLGRVAAPDVSTGEAKAQMNPSVAGFQAFLAAVRVRRNFVDLFQMCTSCHGSSLG